MKILVLDTGLGLELERRLAVEGHDVKVFLTWKGAQVSEALTQFGEGIFDKLGIEKVDHYEDYIDWPELVVATDVVFGGEVSLFLDKGIPVIGGTQEAYDLEVKREEGLELFKKIGMPTPKSWSFESVEDAIEKVTELGESVVVRFGGIDLGDIPRTNVCLEPESAIDILYQVSEKPIKEIIVQEFKKGHEVAVGGYFDGEKFHMININWEYKRLFPGDLGPLCGDMGTVVTFDPEYLESELGQRLIEYLENAADELKSRKYWGYFDVNTIYSPEDDKFYALEWTVRPGYPTEYALMTLIPDYGEFLYNLATSSVKDIIPELNWAVGFSYAAPGYNFEPPSVPSVISGLTIEDISKENYWLDEAYVAIEELYYDEETDSVRVLPNLFGRILIAMGTGDTLDEAVERAKSLFEEIHIHDGYWRIDIGFRVRNFVDGVLE